jgi:hypothetical protein
LSAHVGLRLGRIELPVVSDTDVTDTFAGEEAPVHLLGMPALRVVRELRDGLDDHAANWAASQ